MQIKRNEFVARHIETRREESAIAKFSTKRLLVGQFYEAEEALQKLIRSVIGKTWFKPALTIVMHPLEMIEGGLSQVEDRVLRELAAGVGGKEIRVWIGPSLSNQELINELHKK